jgi:hypothetical protein
MAKAAIDRDAFNPSRMADLGKRVAREVSSLGKGSPPEEVRKAVTRLRSLADELEDRATGGQKRNRQEAARKAARTRQQKARSRSAAAKKAARTRARSS